MDSSGEYLIIELSVLVTVISVIRWQLDSEAYTPDQSLSVGSSCAPEKRSKSRQLGVVEVKVLEGEALDNTLPAFGNDCKRQKSLLVVAMASKMVKNSKKNLLRDSLQSRHGTLYLCGQAIVGLVAYVAVNYPGKSIAPQVQR